MLNKDKNSRKKRSTRQEEIVKRTKKSSNAKSSVVSNNKATRTKERDKSLDKKNTKNTPKKTVKEAPKKKKVKKPKKELTPKQIKARNVLIGILTIIIIGGLCALAVIEFNKQGVTKNNNTQQHKQTLDGLTDEQLITAANAYMGNTNYNFKSVLSKTKESNGDLVATLMATQENNGTYNTKQVNVTYELAGGEPLAINEQEIGKETRTKSAIENSTQVQSKLDVTYKVLDYLEGTGMQINDTNWAMDIYENRTVDGQTGYLIDVYKVQGSVSNSVEWIFVNNSGQMYSIGPNGTGQLQPLQ